MTIEPQILNYIDVAVDKAVNMAVDVAVNKAAVKFDEKMSIFFDKNIAHHIGLQNEFIKDQIALVIEITKDKPGREEVREIAQDELRYHGLHR